jgi:hypothetical protein
VFGADRDPTFPFKIIVVHQAFRHLLVVPKCSGSAKDGVNQSRFSVVDMGDNSEITNVVDWYHTDKNLSKCGHAPAKLVTLHRRF